MPCRSPAQVVLISVDGLRPEFYEDPSFDAPTLRFLASQGARARGVLPIFPTLTYPVHASMVTGLSSSRHGILANYLFSEKSGPSTDWYWGAERIRAPTIWDQARAAGLTTALVRWPVSRGARVDWLVPEVFHSPGIHPEEDWELVRRTTSPELWQEIRRGSCLKTLHSLKEVDDFTTEAAVRILEEKRPELALIHLISLDSAQHATGRDSAETRAALTRADRLIGKIVATTDLKRTVVIVTGDHGFMDFHGEINVNRLFRERGWIQASGDRLLDWKVIAQADGGQAAIYCRDRQLERPAIRVLTDSSQGLYRIIDREGLDRLQAYPGAICALEASPDFILDPRLDAPRIVRFEATHGHHGYLPTHARMRTGFIAAGAGLPRQLDLGVIRVLDIAPTIASLLQMDMPATEGQPVLPGFPESGRGSDPAWQRL